MRGSELSNYLKGFKKGIIQIVFVKLYEQQNTFFTKKEESALVCINIENKVQDSEDFLNGKFKVHNSKANDNKLAESDGILVGSDIAINQAVSKQNEIKQIGL